MKIVLCNGDSLGMPRENVRFKDTWYFNLSNSFSQNEFYFINNFKRANTTNSLVNRDALENYNPNIIILQLGIVDCAPRLYKTNSLLVKIVNRSPLFIKKNFWKVSKKIKKRSILNADVNLKKFEKNITNFLDRCKILEVEKCIIIKIQKPGKIMINKNPEIIKAVNLYNTIFDHMEKIYDFVTVINPLKDGNDDFYIIDGYHVNKIGFNKVYEELKSEIKKC